MGQSVLMDADEGVLREEVRRLRVSALSGIERLHWPSLSGGARQFGAVCVLGLEVVNALLDPLGERLNYSSGSLPPGGIS